MDWTEISRLMLALSRNGIVLLYRMYYILKCVCGVVCKCVCVCVPPCFLCVCVLRGIYLLLTRLSINKVSGTIAKTTAILLSPTDRTDTLDRVLFLKEGPM